MSMGFDYANRRLRRIAVDDEGRLMIVGCPKFTDRDTLKLLFFKRAETLGTDEGTGAFAVDHQQEAAGEPLYTRLTTGGLLNERVTSNGDPLVARAARMPSGGVGGTLVVEIRARTEQLVTCWFWAGFGRILSPGHINDGAIIYYASDFSPNWIASSYDIAIENTDTGVAADTDWHVFHIEITATAVTFYIDDALVATHTVQIPDAGLVAEMNRVLVGAMTKAAGAKYARYEYVAVWNE